MQKSNMMADPSGGGPPPTLDELRESLIAAVLVDIRISHPWPTLRQRAEAEVRAFEEAVIRAALRERGSPTLEPRCRYCLHGEGLHVAGLAKTQCVCGCINYAPQGTPDAPAGEVTDEVIEQVFTIVNSRGKMTHEEKIQAVRAALRATDHQETT